MPPKRTAKSISTMTFPSEALMQSILVTGGAGFIGANFVHFLSAETNVQIINLDRLTYAGNLDSLAPLRGNARHVFVEGDIGDRDLVRRLLGD